MTEKQTIYVIGGPTASGKSAHALKLADETSGVIINADSMQIYDGLHLLTAQPPLEDLKQAPHRLYSALHPNTPCSAGNYREMVEPMIHELLSKGQTPIIVGGSGLYIRALISGLSPIDDIPPAIRNAANSMQKELGNPAFYEELKKRDPIMAARFHPYHTARLIRAWEVLEATGKSLAQWQEQPLIGPPDDWEFDIKLIIPPRDILYKRCNDRFIWMMDNGALDEVSAFHEGLKSGAIDAGVPLTEALGVPELINYINGVYGLDEAIMRAQGQTRRYAKRQTTWFNNQIKPQKNIAKIEILS
ncbi:MAG: tRNA (adenosine(37)-N6)-dimethylallyltransferase MiaA [Alphaproteobacteria bacterium]|nr:tRNA (adenosine(37)-N6)-dimethylallyltransferase MiaA [Alphaproteobacteria bacterium]NCQ89153.1 tRNA (adenosine(37)-N6)-dimethylallyltransferase MiaA [Alphaproteobacteria bacterium]NCT08257.1 tRNA (adenosine(37)-N6)-dimethylallyltransferase MiaA [Alphaproteobacteria bacterium]